MSACVDNTSISLRCTGILVFSSENSRAATQSQRSMILIPCIGLSDLLILLYDIFCPIAETIHKITNKLNRKTKQKNENDPVYDK